MSYGKCGTIPGREILTTTIFSAAGATASSSYPTVLANVTKRKDELN